MFTAHELIGFMSPALSAQILEQTLAEEKGTYRAALAAVAEAKHVRPVFMERKPRAERHSDMVEALSKPRLEMAAATLIRGWLLKKHSSLLVDFLDALGVANENGVVEDLPATMDDAKLKAAVETALAKHPREVVIVYLHAFYEMNEARWPNLKSLLETDPRLQLAG